MRLRNILLVVKDQMPLKRFIRNFFITRNGWGLFHKNSHISFSSGKPKIMYSRKASAEKGAASMNKKTGNVFSAYKCLHCDGFHIGKNKIHNPVVK
jgi:hypothetical protein